MPDPRTPSRRDLTGHPLAHPPRCVAGAVAGGKRRARARNRASRYAAAARTTAAVPYRLYQFVENDGRLRSVIVEVADARAVAGELRAG